MKLLCSLFAYVFCRPFSTFNDPIIREVEVPKLPKLEIPVFKVAVAGVKYDHWYIWYSWDGENFTKLPKVEKPFVWHHRVEVGNWIGDEKKAIAFAMKLKEPGALDAYLASVPIDEARYIDEQNKMHEDRAARSETIL